MTGVLAITPRLAIREDSSSESSGSYAAAPSFACLR
jgi:hypothetical protein